MSALPQVLDLVRRRSELTLQIVGKGRQVDDVVELVGCHGRPVAQPALGGLVLPAGSLGRPLAWPATAWPRRLFSRIIGHGWIVAHFRA
ncbi:MAG: hypothetical protein ABW122_16135 [Ilumatobacteraceae bacterium]